jgi:hypothetical protein
MDAGGDPGDAEEPLPHHGRLHAVEGVGGGAHDAQVLGKFARGAVDVGKRRPRQLEPVMPKSRYRIMAGYMPKVGSLGLDMMFRTATVQVNLSCRG